MKQLRTPRAAGSGVDRHTPPKLPSVAPDCRHRISFELAASVTQTASFHTFIRQTTGLFDPRDRPRLAYLTLNPYLHCLSKCDLSSALGKEMVMTPFTMTRTLLALFCFCLLPPFPTIFFFALFGDETGGNDYWSSGCSGFWTIGARLLARRRRRTGVC